MNKTSLAPIFIIVAGMAVAYGASDLRAYPENANKRKDACRNGVNVELPADDLALLRLKACASMPSIWLHQLIHS